MKMKKAVLMDQSSDEESDAEDNAMPSFGQQMKMKKAKAAPKKKAGFLGGLFGGFGSSNKQAVNSVPIKEQAVEESLDARQMAQMNY